MKNPHRALAAGFAATAALGAAGVALANVSAGTTQNPETTLVVAPAAVSPAPELNEDVARLNADIAAAQAKLDKLRTFRAEATNTSKAGATTGAKAGAPAAAPTPATQPSATTSKNAPAADTWTGASGSTAKPKKENAGQVDTTTGASGGSGSTWNDDDNEDDEYENEDNEDEYENEGDDDERDNDDD